MKMIDFKLIWLGLLLVVLLPCFSVAEASDISTSLTRNPVNLDESFEITFTATHEPDDDPDFSLLEQDFVIINRSQNSSFSWINGKATKTVQWQLKVMAKHSGTLNIPAIAFGSEKSNPLSVSVITGNNPVSSRDEDLFIEAEAEPLKPFVQSQVLYTLRIFSHVEIARGELQEPELDNALIEKMGNDVIFSRQINGIDYSVTERKYAIFPQKSGKTTIKPIELKADVIADSQHGINSFFNSQLTQTKRVRSNAIALEVKPAPTTFSGSHWLPAQELTVTQHWSGNVRQLKVGEPLTRTLTITAKGTTVGQLPELNNVSSKEDLKAYPDQPLLQEQKLPDGISTVREEKIALIASKSGEYALPAIEIPWFNTKTQKMETAALPAVKINAIGTSTIAEQTAPPSPLPTVQNPSVLPAIKPVDNNPLPGLSASFWPWLCAFLAIGWLITLVYLYLFARKKTKLAQNQEMDIKLLSIKDSIHALKLACNHDDAHAARDALLIWGKLQYGSVNLSKLAERCEARLRDEILILNRVLYGQNSSQWQGKKLLQAFSENKARTKLANAENDGLEPLYRL